MQQGQEMCNTLHLGEKEKKPEPGAWLVAHSCNPSYSGGRDLEDFNLKPVQTYGSRDPISKIPIIKKGW
jgi:hypothetical protein